MEYNTEMLTALAQQLTATFKFALVMLNSLRSERGWPPTPALRPFH